MKLDKTWFVIGALLGALGAAIAYAATADQIWQAVYDAATHTIRVTAI